MQGVCEHEYFYSIVITERIWLNPSTEKYQKTQEETALKKKAAQELITAKQQTNEYKACSATILEPDE